MSRSVLTAQQVQKIRYLLSNGVTQKAIAERFGVSPAAVSKIKIGKNWSHVTDAE